MKPRKLWPLLFLLACSDVTGPSEVGGVSRCQRDVAGIVNFSLPGDPRVYALEIGLCAYVVDLPRPEADADGITLLIGRENLMNAVRKLR